MAYMDQARKKALEPAVKAICQRHGVKATLSVRHHSTLVLTISAGSIDFFGDRLPPTRVPEHLREYAAQAHARAAEQGHMDVNPHWWQEHFAEGSRTLAFLAEVMPALNVGNHDRSDTMTDLWDVGWWVEIQIGRWDRAYRLEPRPAQPAAPANGAHPARKIAVDVAPRLFLMPLAQA